MWGSGGCRGGEGVQVGCLEGEGNRKNKLKDWEKKAEGNKAIVKTEKKLNGWGVGWGGGAGRLWKKERGTVRTEKKMEGVGKETRRK
jgi:hypothetical protein